MMSEFLFYLLKTSGVFGALYLVYFFLLSKITFHNVNRVFLLAMLPLSLIIPHIDVEFISKVPLSNIEIPLFFNDFGYIGGDGLVTDVVNDSGWNIGHIWILLYSLGVFISLMKLVLNVLKLLRIKHQSTTYVDGDFTIIHANVPLVFSFFKWIFVPLNNKDNIDTSIIEHEKFHGKAGHTFDLIATELFISLLWFNPFTYFFRQDLKSVHEFQVDSRLLQHEIKKSDYLQLILNNLDSTRNTVSLYNYFGAITIKKRIDMIFKNNSSKWQILRYLLIIPILAIMTMSFTNPTIKNGNVPSISPIKIGDYDKISSGFGMRLNPILKVKKFHSGIDFIAKKGINIIATADGVVTKVAFQKEGYGKMVVINHGEGFERWYTHMSDYAVKQGDKIKKGKVVGYVGSSGSSAGPHLHYEVRRDGKPVNPQDYIK